jgi:hypothetical protein
MYQGTHLCVPTACPFILSFRIAVSGGEEPAVLRGYPVNAAGHLVESHAGFHFQDASYRSRFDHAGGIG